LVSTDGDIIKVAAGIYNETLTISVSVTLLGAQSGVDARQRPFPPSSTGPGAESIIQFVAPNNAIININTPNVVLDGFVLRNNVSTPPGSGTSKAVKTSNLYSGYQFLNTIFYNNDVGLDLNSTLINADASIVSQNVFTENGRDDIWTASGFQLSNAIIDDNNFINSSNDPTFGEAAINLENTVNLQITNNLFSNSNSVALTANYSAGSLSNTLIQNNCFSQSNGSCIFFSGGTTDTRILNNSFINSKSNAISINVFDFAAVGANTDIVVNRNNFVNSAHAALRVDVNSYAPNTLKSLDATDNWWNSAMGPILQGTATPIGPNSNGQERIIDLNLPINGFSVVNYQPFLTVPVPSSSLISSDSPCFFPLPPSPTPPSPMPGMLKLDVISLSSLLTDADGQHKCVKKDEKRRRRKYAI
jgi:hypothetical protein